MKIPVLLLLAVAVLGVPGARAQIIHAVTETSGRAAIVGGKVRGPMTDAVELTLKAAGLTDYRTSVYPWARTYQIALREPNTLIYPIARIPAREGQFKWVGEIERVHFYFVKLATRKDIVVNRLDDAKAYSIGVVRDDVRHHYLKDHGFTNLLVTGKWNDNFSHLMNRQIDMLAVAEFDLDAACAEHAVNCAIFERAFALPDMAAILYMAYSRSTPDAIVERTRAAFDKLKAEGVIDKVLKAKP